MSPWRAYLLLLQEFSRWIGTYGGMIRSDLHGDEIPTNGCCNPTRGEEKPEDYTRDTLTDLDPWGGFSFPPGR